MATKLIGSRTWAFAAPPVIRGYAAVVGKKEGEGPLGDCFDLIGEDTSFGEKTWEKAESRLQKESLNRALAAANVSQSQLTLLLAGDLLNQCISSTYGLREYDVPFLGLFGACSTMAEGLCTAAMAIDGGFADLCGVVTSSHFCSAERQFRTPLEYGGQRPPTAQWTVTGSGSIILGHEGCGPRITHATVGKIIDPGITDSNNMGAAMAAAACDTLCAFFQDTGDVPADYDLIVSGDLGVIGRRVVKEQLSLAGYDMSNVYNDCGCMIYDLKTRDVNSGGSGCGCSASVLAGYILPRLKTGIYKNVLFMATGALMSPTAIQQGESIPGVAHLVRISMEGEKSK